MGRARRTARSQALKPCDLMESFYAFDRPTETTAARLRVFHRWNLAPGGAGHIKHIKPRFAVTISTILLRVVANSRNCATEKEAKDLFATYTGALAHLEVNPVQARDHFAEITGTGRFWHCRHCRSTLELAALWCTECGRPAKGHPSTAALTAAT